MKTKSTSNGIRPHGQSTKNPIEIENIEDMRQGEGIDDAELHQEIRQLHVGDAVKVTFLNGAKWSETLLVRIMSIKGSAFRGRLVQMPTATGLAALKLDSSVPFNAAHIHSVVPKTSIHELSRP